MKLKKTFLSLLFCASTFTAIQADVLHNSMPQPLGGEASGLGGAYTALSEEGSGVFYNPAMFVNPDGRSLDLSLKSVSLENQDQTQLIRSLRADPSFIAVQGQSTGNYAGFLMNDSTESNSKLTLEDDPVASSYKNGIQAEQDLIRVAQAKFLGFTYSHPVSEAVVLGVGITYWDVELQESSDSHFTYTNRVVDGANTLTFDGSSSRTFLRSAVGSGVQLKTGIKYRGEGWSLGATLAPEASLSYKAKSVYRYRAGLHLLSATAGHCTISGTGTIPDACADEFRTASQSLESSYSEKLPNQLGFGLALFEDNWKVSADILYSGAVEYAVPALNITEVSAADGFLNVGLNESEYISRKKSVLRWSLGGRTQLNEWSDYTFSMLIGTYSDPGSREFDEGSLGLQQGLQNVDYSGTTLGIMFSTPSYQNYFGGIQTNGKGQRVVTEPSAGYSIEDFNLTRTNFIYSAGVFF
jgi:hypothetical protein